MGWPSGPLWCRTSRHSAISPRSPGTTLVTVSGAVGRSGVLEVPVGTPLSSIVDGGCPVGRPAAALVGGYFGTWVPASQFGLPFSRAGLKAAGASPGAGIVIVLPDGACGLARLERWASQVEGRGACKHPDGSVRLLRSALRVFPRDIDRHLRGQPCPGSFAVPVIPVPRPGPSRTWR